MEKVIEFQLLRLELRSLGWTCWPYCRSHLCSIHDLQVSVAPPCRSTESTDWFVLSFTQRYRDGVASAFI